MIAQAHASLSRLYTARDQMVFLLEHAQDLPMNEDEQAFAARIKTYGERFDSAMDDDLNTADAIGALFEIVRDANVTLTAESSKAAIETALKKRGVPILPRQKFETAEAFAGFVKKQLAAECPLLVEWSAWGGH